MTQQGSLERTKDTKYVVSYWHIPRGADYQNAVTCLRFFDSVEEGKEFESKNSNSPESAVGLFIEDYDRHYARHSKLNGIIKRGRT